MSGRCSAASATACRPSAASATTSMSSSASSSDRMPLRISAWSSASRILITTVPARAVRRVPGSRRRPAVRPADGRRARTPVPACRPGQAQGLRRPGAAALAVVVDLDREGFRRVVQVNRRAGMAGVTAHVGERFLHDPVGSLVHLGRKRPLRAGHGHRHGEPGRPRACHQAVQLAEAAAVAVLRRCAARRASRAVPARRPRLPPGSPAARAALPRRACGPGAAATPA